MAKHLRPPDVGSPLSSDEHQQIEQLLWQLFYRHHLHPHLIAASVSRRIAPITARQVVRALSGDTVRWTRLNFDAASHMHYTLTQLDEMVWAGLICPSSKWFAYLHATAGLTGFQTLIQEGRYEDIDPTLAAMTRELLAERRFEAARGGRIPAVLRV